MKSTVLFTVKFLLFFTEVVLAGLGPPNAFEKRAFISASSVKKVGETLPKLKGPLPYDKVFDPAKPTVKSPFLEAVEEVGLIFVDVQNDFCDHSSDFAQKYTPSLAVPGAQKAIYVMNAVRAAGIFPDKSTSVRGSKFVVVYRSEDYHVPDSYTFATSPCWLGSFLGTILDYTQYIFRLVYIPASEPTKEQDLRVFEDKIFLWPPHCVAGTYGQHCNKGLIIAETDRVILKAVYKLRESLTAVVDYNVGEALSDAYGDHELINMKRDLALKFPNVKVMLVMGFEFMNCVKATALSLAAIKQNGTPKYRVFIVVDAVGYFAPPDARQACLDELKNYGVELIESRGIALTYNGLQQVPVV